MDINFRLFNEYTCEIHSFMVIFFIHSCSSYTWAWTAPSPSQSSYVAIKSQARLNQAPKSPTRIRTKYFSVYSHLSHFSTFAFSLFHTSHTIRPDNITLTTNSCSSQSSLTTMTYHVSNDNPTTLPDDDYPSGICYGYHDTAYYYYLTVYFPW